MRKICGLIAVVLISMLALPVAAYSALPESGFAPDTEACVDYEVVFARGSGTAQNESDE